MIQILNVMIAGQLISIEVPQQHIISASAMFDKMDIDMSKGWTIGREFVANPETIQRCQIVADKLLTAIEDNNEQMKSMMSAYILSRVPDIKMLHIDNTAEINETVVEINEL